MIYSYQSLDAKPPFDCSKCDNKRRDKLNCRNHKKVKETAVDEYTPTIERDLKEKGVYKNKIWNLGDIRLYECPIGWITTDTRTIMELIFLTADTNILLFPGTWLDQPTWFVEAWHIYKREQRKFIKSDGAKRTT